MYLKKYLFFVPLLLCGVKVHSTPTVTCQRLVPDNATFTPYHPKRTHFQQWRITIDSRVWTVRSRGNPFGIPVVVFHGGPGLTHNPVPVYNLDVFQVIEVQQPGAGDSVTKACCAEQDSFLNSIHPSRTNEISMINLVQDFHIVLRRIGVISSDASKKIIIHASSWGGFLSFLYSSLYPETVQHIIVRGNWLLTEQNFRDIFWDNGNNKHYFPQAWENLINFISQGKPKPKNYLDVMRLVAEKFESKNPAVVKKITALMASWEYSLATNQLKSYDPSSKKVEEMLVKYQIVGKFIENKYFMLTKEEAEKIREKHALEIKNASIPYPQWILLKLGKILPNYVESALEADPNFRKIPVTFIHGKRDLLTPFRNVETLLELMPNSRLILIPEGGHDGSTPAMKSAQKDAIDEIILSDKKTMPKIVSRGSLYMDTQQEGNARSVFSAVEFPSYPIEDNIKTGNKAQNNPVVVSRNHIELTALEYATLQQLVTNANQIPIRNIANQYHVNEEEILGVIKTLNKKMLTLEMILSHKIVNFVIGTTVKEIVYKGKKQTKEVPIKVKKSGTLMLSVLALNTYSHGNLSIKPLVFSENIGASKQSPIVVIDTNRKVTLSYQEYQVLMILLAQNKGGLQLEEFHLQQMFSFSEGISKFIKKLDDKLESIDIVYVPATDYILAAYRIKLK